MDASGINNLAADRIAELERQLAELRGVSRDPPQETGNVSAPAVDPRQTARPRRRKQKKAISYLTEEELAALFRAIAAEGKASKVRANTVRDTALFSVAYRRGLRASEVGLLQFAHLRLGAKRLYVTRLKGGTSGEFMLTEAEIRDLKGYLKVRGNKSGALFLSRNSKPISRRRLDELMKFYGERSGLALEKRHFHCLRHSCATALLDRDVSIEEVQDHLGHTDIRNTMIYAKVTNKKRQRKDERLAREW